jgi:hypothetical protein
MAADRGDCNRARELVRDARADADDIVDQRLLKDRFHEVESAISSCKTMLSGTRRRRRR